MKWLSCVCILAIFAATGCSKSDEPVAPPAYVAFADQHWSDGPYWDSLFATRGIEKWQDSSVFAHALEYQVVGTDTVLVRNDAFYLNICKYDQFVWGWDDLAQVSTGAIIPEEDYASSNRGAYCDMRNQ